MIPRIVFLCAMAAGVRAQEAESGFELRTTVSAESLHSHQLTEEPREGAPVTGGFQALLYPAWKLNSHWTVSGALQVHSRPYFPEEFYSQGYGVKTNILNASISYSQFWKKASLVVRAGQLTSAFGSFLLRYDPAVNPLPGVPGSYGYYAGGVQIQGLAGAQVDATSGPFDLRVQFTNSSPANPRSIFDRDQYGGWAGGAGYTISQGFRVGVSAYRGPYLDRHYKYYFRGEAPPRDLPATGYGLDVQWGRGPWNVYGEWQGFQMSYRKIPNYNLHTGYAEVRRVLHPRWYAATRVGYSHPVAFPGTESYEIAAGFRPAANQILKFGYTIERGPAIHGTLDNVAVIQFVTSFRAFGTAGK
ncbi:MAG TPA: hypothetical protein VLN48_16120 [Bryobacteraceae bacterium]|nr:hypothetical protein [Bryobacteraceae bacterium]